MSIRSALKGQYHGALAMLKRAIESCPERMWDGDAQPVPFWQVAYHTLYFTHLYLQPSIAHFRPWAQHRGEHHDLPWPPGSRPSITDPYAKAEILVYWSICDAMVDEAVDALDLEAADCGIPWHKGMPKLDHQLHNIRHIQHHAAILSGRLRAADGTDVDWVRWK